ncbi:unnamed protein product [Schistosoma turkestanicum]|nr:unnamed protein product [Schistosoma turkestanicum]
MSFSDSNVNFIYPPKFEIQVTSETNDKRKENNLISIPCRIVYKPKVNIFAGIQPSTIIDDRLEPYTTKQNTISRKLFSYDIGPRIEHTFLIENQGWITMTNLSLILQLPYETTDGHRLLYLTDQIREASYTNQTTLLKNILPTVISSDGRQFGACELPKEFINPLELTLMDFKFIDGTTRKSAYNSLVRNTKRNKRNIKQSHKSSLSYSQNMQNSDTNLTSDLYQNIIQQTNKNRIILNCPYLSHLTNTSKSIQSMENDYLIKCINVQCKINHFKHGDTVRLKWTGWLWAETFFQLQKSDIQFISRLNIDNWGDLPMVIKAYHDIQENLSRNQSHTLKTSVKFIDIKYPLDNYFELKQSIIFHGVQLKVTRKVPLWPVITGIVVGLWILIILCALLYCCGFFTRRRKYSTMTVKKMSFSHINNNFNEENHHDNDIDKFSEWNSLPDPLIKSGNSHRNPLEISNSKFPMLIKNNQFKYDDNNEKVSQSNSNDNLFSEEHVNKDNVQAYDNECQHALVKTLTKPNENDDCFNLLLLKQPKTISPEKYESQKLEVIEEDKESSRSSIS